MFLNNANGKIFYFRNISETHEFWSNTHMSISWIFFFVKWSWVAIPSLFPYWDASNHSSRIQKHWSEWKSRGNWGNGGWRVTQDEAKAQPWKPCHAAREMCIQYSICSKFQFAKNANIARYKHNSNYCCVIRHFHAMANEEKTGAMVIPYWMCILDVGLFFYTLSYCCRHIGECVTIPQYLIALYFFLCAHGVALPILPRHFSFRDRAAQFAHRVDAFARILNSLFFDQVGQWEIPRDLLYHFQQKKICTTELILLGLIRIIFH